MPCAVPEMLRRTTPYASKGIVNTISGTPSIRLQERYGYTSPATAFPDDNKKYLTTD